MWRIGPAPQTMPWRADQQELSHRRKQVDPIAGQGIEGCRPGFVGRPERAREHDPALWKPHLHLCPDDCSIQCLTRRDGWEAQGGALQTKEHSGHQRTPARAPMWPIVPITASRVAGQPELERSCGLAAAPRLRTTNRALPWSIWLDGCPAISLPSLSPGKARPPLGQYDKGQL